MINKSVRRAGAPLGSAMGTIFGGLPTGLSSIQWRGTFCVLAGLSALSFLCTVWTAPKNPKAKVPGGPDWIGTFIITAGLTLFLFCMSQGECSTSLLMVFPVTKPYSPCLLHCTGPEVGWNTGYIIGLITIGCLSFPAFVFYEIWVEKKGNTPMLRMSK